MKISITLTPEEALTLRVACLEQSDALRQSALAIGGGYWAAMKFRKAKVLGAIVGKLLDPNNLKDGA